MSKLFGKFGEITSCAVMKDHDGKSKKFGFVNFANADGARNAIQELHEQDSGLKNAASEPVRLYV
jgi:polyadenylate-binding protein